MIASEELECDLANRVCRLVDWDIRRSFSANLKYKKGVAGVRGCRVCLGWI